MRQALREVVLHSNFVEELYTPGLAKQVADQGLWLRNTDIFRAGAEANGRPCPSAQSTTRLLLRMFVL